MKKEDLLKKENGEALVLLNRLKILGKRESKLLSELYETRTKLQEVCIHNDTEIINDYIEGGYLDREVYIEKLICKTCNKELERKETLGGFC